MVSLGDPRFPQPKGPPKEKSLTDDSARAWANMGMKPKFQIERLVDWANMLETRLAQLDPEYRSYNWGRRDGA